MNWATEHTEPGNTFIGTEYNIFVKLIICNAFVVVVAAVGITIVIPFQMDWFFLYFCYLEMLSKVANQEVKPQKIERKQSTAHTHTLTQWLIVIWNWHIGLICSMKCPLKHAKWIWMNSKLIRSVTVGEKGNYLLLELVNEIGERRKCGGVKHYVRSAGN